MYDAATYFPTTDAMSQKITLTIVILQTPLLMLTLMLALTIRNKICL